MKPHYFKYNGIGVNYGETIEGTIEIELSKPEVSSLKGNRGSYTLSKQVRGANPEERLIKAIIEDMGDLAYTDSYKVTMDWVSIRPKSYLYQEMSLYSFELFIPCQDPSSNKKMEVIRAISDKLRYLSLEECQQINTMIDNIG